MAGATQNVIRELRELGRPFWLPPGGWGNGLDDDSWAAVLDVTSEYIATLLLLSLQEAGVPAYAAALKRPLSSRRRAGESWSPRVRIWVGAAHHGAGEVTILRLLPGLIEKYGPRIIP